MQTGTVVTVLSCDRPGPPSSSEASPLLPCRPPGPRGQALTPDHEATAERGQGASRYDQGGERFGAAHKPPAPQSQHKPRRARERPHFQQKHDDRTGAGQLISRSHRENGGTAASPTSFREEVRQLTCSPEGHLSWRRRWESLRKGGRKAGPRSLGC